MADAIDRTVLEIDKFRLDEEWIRQPSLYLEWSEQLALARSRLDKAKAQLDVEEAELAMLIRRKPKAHGFTDKPTEAAIKACIISHARYQEANRNVVRAKHRVDVCYAMTVALDHKKKALENLVQLEGRQYFSQPVAKNQSDRERLEHRKRRSIPRPE